MAKINVTAIHMYEVKKRKYERHLNNKHRPKMKQQQHQEYVICIV